MTHPVVATFSTAQHRILFALAARDGVTVERWVEQATLSAIDRDTGESRKLPRRDADAKAPWGKTPPLVACRHCGIATRPVKSCDNCERPLS